ncbi:hypothetical protein [Clostridium oryzae]|uniref:Uncharacterized protein n=1 Tax=Clostridium oryzae TaxID=1450648 RepID=A0A1V4IIQ5_9CLOT|nr:hypothetical protein [Clostridium oryzae]OPJ59724.1 hypothetical protein CLORY_31720 [Clostridium oryzae]
MKSIKVQLFMVVLTVLLFVIGFHSIFSKKILAKADSVHTLTFNNKLKVKTLFYPYRDPGNTADNLRRHLQGLTIDTNDNIYLTYAVCDETRYAYIYVYNKKGKLLRKSKKMPLGHGQAISYKNGYLYQLADIKDQTNFSLLKIDPYTFRIVRSWTIPSTIHPNVLFMQDDNTGISVSRYLDGYDINKIHLTEGPDAQRDWHEKIHISGFIGITPNREIQGFTYRNGQYHLLSNGEYMTFNPDGSNVKHISMNTKRESEGIGVMSNGKLVFGFNRLNELFIQQ